MTTLDTTTGLVTLTGHDAIAFATNHGFDGELEKITDPTEGSRTKLSAFEAAQIAKEDPELVRLEVEPVTYLARWARDAWGGVPVTEEEHESACRRATDYLTDHEGDALSITVTPCSTTRHEIPGTYRIGDFGREQILGGSISEPEDVRDLLLAAFEHACKTWPKD